MENRLVALHRRAGEIFQQADKDGNGWLSKRELKRVIHSNDDIRFELRTSGGRPWKDFWRELDENNDGRIQEQELVDYLTKVQVDKTAKHTASVKKRAQEIFERADRDKNGWLSKTELKRVLHEDDDLRDELRAAHGRHWKDFWHELDANDDGRIDLQELIAYIEKQHTQHVERAVSAATEAREGRGTAPESDAAVGRQHTDMTLGERMQQMRAHVQEIFERADRDKNGWLSKTELKRVLHEDDDLRFELRASGGRPWKDFWHELDANNDGKIEEEELVDYLMKVQVERVGKHHASVKKRAQEIFERADRDKNGWLSKTELKRVLHEDDDLRDELRAAHGRHWKDFWHELDANDDGKIELPELMHYMEKSHHRHITSALEHAGAATSLVDAAATTHPAKATLPPPSAANELGQSGSLTAQAGGAGRDNAVESPAAATDAATKATAVTSDSSSTSSIGAPAPGTEVHGAAGPVEKDSVCKDAAEMQGTAARQQEQEQEQEQEQAVPEASDDAEELRAQLKEKDARIAELLAALESKTSAGQTGAEEAGALRVKELEEELAKAKRAQAEEAAARKELESKVHWLERDNEELQTSYAGAEGRIGILMEQIETLESRVDEVNEGDEEQEARVLQGPPLGPETGIDDAPLGMVAGQEADGPVSAASLEAKLKEAATDSVGEARECSDCETQLAAARSQVAALQEEVSEVRTAAAAAEQRAEDLERRLGESTDAHKQAQERAAELEAVQKRLADCEAARKADAAAFSGATKKEADMEDLRRALAASRDECEALKKSLAQLKARRPSSAARGSRRPSSSASSRPAPRPSPTDATHKQLTSVLKDSGLQEGDLAYHGPGKYKLFGDDRILNVRTVGNVIMVRVGGGWCKLQDYLKDHRHHIEDARVRYSLQLKANQRRAKKPAGH